MKPVRLFHELVISLTKLVYDISSKRSNLTSIRSEGLNTSPKYVTSYTHSHSSLHGNSLMKKEKAYFLSLQIFTRREMLLIPIPIPQ
jgi:hypothetical protein